MAPLVRRNKPGGMRTESTGSNIPGETWNPSISPALLRAGLYYFKEMNMAHVQVVREWKPLRLFPWVEVRECGAFLDTAPHIPLDLVPFWNEYRWRKPRS